MFVLKLQISIEKYMIWTEMKDSDFTLSERDKNQMSDFIEHDYDNKVELFSDELSEICHSGDSWSDLFQNTDFMTEIMEKMVENEVFSDEYKMIEDY